MRYFIRQKDTPWEEIDYDTFWKMLKQQTFWDNRIKIKSVLKRHPIVGTTHMFKIERENEI